MNQSEKLHRFVKCLIGILEVISCTSLPKTQFLFSVKCKNLFCGDWSECKYSLYSLSWVLLLHVFFFMRDLSVVSYSLDLCASLFLPWQTWEKEAQNQTPKTLQIRLCWAHCNWHASNIKCKPARKHRLKIILSPSEEYKEYTEFSAKNCVKVPK